jgi:hypothetical protein
MGRRASATVPTKGERRPVALVASVLVAAAAASRFGSATAALPPH